MSARLLFMYGPKGAFFKSLAAGAQRTQRNVFNIPLTTRPTLWTPDRDFTKGNTAGLMDGEQNAYLLRKIEFNAKKQG
jgi:hypothetical protein